MDKILDLWLPNNLMPNGRNNEGSPAMMKLWYMGGKEVDDQCREFEQLLEACANDELEDWLSDTQGLLAYVILCDQFSRNMHRDNAKSFATDERARRVVKKMIGQGKLGDYKIFEIILLMMPLMHSEENNGYDVVAMQALIQTYIIDAHKNNEDEKIKQFAEKIGTATIGSG
jgi:uncharacterized protein (DUF924 family)